MGKLVQFCEFFDMIDIQTRKCIGGVLYKKRELTTIVPFPTHNEYQHKVGELTTPTTQGKIIIPNVICVSLVLIIPNPLYLIQNGLGRSY